MYNSEGKPKTNLVQVACLSATLDTHSKWQEKLIRVIAFVHVHVNTIAMGRGGKGTSVNKQV